MRARDAQSPSDARRPRWHARHRAWQVTLLIVAFFASACGGGGDSDADSGELTEEASLDYATFDVSFREDAVVLDDLAAVQMALRAADLEAGQLRFDAGFPDLQQLEVGSAALIGGIGIFRVQEMQTSGDEVSLSVEEAPLTDIIEDGVIAWRRSFLSAADDEKLGLGVDEDETSSIRRLSQPLSFGPNGLNYMGRLNGLTVSMQLSNQQNRTISVSFSGKYEAGGAVADISLEGRLSALTNETVIEIVGSSVTSFRVETSRVDGDFTLQASGTGLGSSETKFSVPARISLPVVLGGIPFNVTVGGGLEIASTLGAEANINFTGRARFTGSAGVNLEGTDLSTLGSLESSNLTLTGSSASNARLSVGYRVTSVFPEVGVGVGMKAIAQGNAFVRFKQELITNFQIDRQLGLFGVPMGDSRTCLKANIGVGATYGGSASFLGKTVSAIEVPIFTRYADEKQSGDGCE